MEGLSIWFGGVVVQEIEPPHLLSAFVEGWRVLLGRD